MPRSRRRSADQYDIPETGNGVPDVLDEAKWGLDYLTRLQESDGSLISIVGEAAASPPSAATGQTLVRQSEHLGHAGDGGRLRVRRARVRTAQLRRAQGLRRRSTCSAPNECTWAEANPKVMFKNNDQASGSAGLGSGQQETDDSGAASTKLDAAAQLFA